MKFNYDRLLPLHVHSIPDRLVNQFNKSIRVSLALSCCPYQLRDFPFEASGDVEIDFDPKKVTNR